MQVQNNLKQISEKYFEAFAQKNLHVLSEMFTDDVVLFDPIIKEVKSKEEVLAANKKIFESAQEIKFVFKRIFVDNEALVSTAELKIDFDGKLIEVVDIIEFDEMGKIKKITAYLDSKQVS